MLLFFLLPVLLLPGCDDEAFFELTNPPEFPWLNMDELERGVVAPYNLALSSGWGNFVGNDRVLFDGMTSAVYLLPNTAADLPFEEIYYRQTDIEVARMSQSFVGCYKTITHANAVLDFLASTDYQPYGEPDAAMRANLNRIQGEMLFLRAFAYYHLARRHAPVPGGPGFTDQPILPLRLTTPTSAEAANQPEYVPTSVLFDQIQADLAAAKQLLPLSYVAGLHPESYSDGRVNRYAAAAQLARVHFYLGDGPAAIEELDFVIAGPYTLDEAPIEAFNKDIAAAGAEVIWYQSVHDRAIVTTNKVPTSMNYSDYRAQNGGRGSYHKRCTWHQFPASHPALQFMGWMDAGLNETEAARTDLRYRQLFWRLEGFNGNPTADPTQFETQYPHITEAMVWGDKYYRGTDGEFTNVPLIRLAEMHLTRAILRLRQGADAGALEDLNRVRQRAGLGPLETLVEEDIHRERLRELAFEGDWFTYRQALRLPILPGQRPNAQPITYPYPGLYWKLPQAELDF